METIAEREAAAKIDWRNVRMYDEDGTQIKNPKTLRAMAESMEIADEWERRIDRYLRERALEAEEEDEEVGSEEEN